jgi:hypothetical protein
VVSLLPRAGGTGFARSDNTDALRRDIIISDHDARGFLTRDHDVRGQRLSSLPGKIPPACLLEQSGRSVNEAGQRRFIESTYKAPDAQWRRPWNIGAPMWIVFSGADQRGLVVNLW